MDRQICETVCLSEDGKSLVIIDQTKLPGSFELLHLTDIRDIHDAIYALKVRGAPAIGVAAAYGIYLAALQMDTEDPVQFADAFERARAFLDSARPTAVNLSWALGRMARVVKENGDRPVGEILELLRAEADRIHDEDIDVCRRIGENGLAILPKKAGILTHCNAGRLAAVRYGTATAPIYVGQEKGYDFHVYCDETRPLLQGIRLTAYELMDAGIQTTVICDNMAPTVLRKGLVQAVLVGCDRVARNGDTANKIGTSGVALAAGYYHVPFYVCAPTSTIDMHCESGDQIPIEERPGHEITEMWYERRMAPDNVGVFNPSFDVTDACNITGIITEYGIAYPPYEISLAEIFRQKEAAQGAK